ncbi:DUF2744 domain-containing protein [Nocardia sp. NBC_01388]|uniref:phage gene 29 protein family protein n=1 Tax=Nocardia sp. NBC_01388 TaxID=2903596 RepID=UPI00324693D4
MIPLQEHQDPENPEEHFLWALVSLPGPKGAPMLVSPKILRKWSEHLWNAGFRHHPHEQTHEYHPPARGPHHWVNGAGRWVQTGTVARAQRITAPDISGFTPEERRNLVEQLQAHGELKHLVDRSELDIEHTHRKGSVGEYRPPRPGRGGAGTHQGKQ